jgi:hypothetical protein
MKKLVLIFLVLPFLANAQFECENHAAVGISYILPKSASAEVAYFTNIGFTAGVGVAYSTPVTTTIKSGTEEITEKSNMLNIFGYVGYRLVQVDYKFSGFLNAGYVMGDESSVQPFVSSKFLFPSGQKAFAIEPLYIFDRGLSARASLYIKL